MSDRVAADPCGSEPVAPRRPDNRPGLDEIEYRIGTHSSFLRRMKWRIARQEVVDPGSGDRSRPLVALTERETSDPSIALMDAWAASLDVLSFYTERIANEGFLPTAVERSSMVELARTIGYELAPGVAASAYLAFVVDDSDDPFRAVEVPSGTQAMSIPQVSSELPQVYETAEPINARAEWNEIPVRTEEPQHLAVFWDDGNASNPRNGRVYLFDLNNALDSSELPVDSAISDEAALQDYYPLDESVDLPTALRALEEDKLYNDQIDASLRAVEVDQVYLRGVGLRLAVGGRMIAVGAQNGDEKQVRCSPLRIVEVNEDQEYGVTRVVFSPLQGPQSSGAGPPLLELKRPPVMLRPKFRIGVVANRPVAFSAATVKTQVLRTAWTGATLGAFLKVHRWSRLELMKIVREPKQLVPPKLGDVVLGFHAFRDSAGFFGNTAPQWGTLATPEGTRGGADGKDPYETSWDEDEPTIWTTSQGSPNGAGADAFLEREIDRLASGQWALLESPQGHALPLRVATVTHGSRADYATTGKATGLAFRRAGNEDLEVGPPGALAEDLKPYSFRTARAHVISEHLSQAGAPVRESVREGDRDLPLDNLYLDLEPGRPVSLAGERADAPGVSESETLIVDEVLHVGGATRVLFSSGPEFPYRRASVRLNANVALATHGEAYDEQLGSGDASASNQSFALAKTPLTFVAAPTETGVASTLVVRVDGIEWTEVPFLLDAGPRDSAYQVRIDDDGTTRVIFGDGRHGRRLPTGQLNVTASYRTGIGSVGDAPDEVIAQLKTRPLGIRSVLNPSPATGSSERESLDSARLSAPRSVRTLGRIVSLTDYEDFARGFAGIGKATAVALWRGRERLVHITVAPEIEGVFDDDSETLRNLRRAVGALRNPVHSVEISAHATRLFSLSATLECDPAHLPEDVLGRSHDALAGAFGYPARALTESVSAADVVAVLQGVDGVVGTDLDDLYAYDAQGAEEAGGLAQVLPARTARTADGVGRIAPAELLTLLTGSARLRCVSIDV